MPEQRDFLLADLGEGLEEATIVEWLVAVGDEVTLNQLLCRVESAKAEVEVPSPFAGTVVELGGEPGETIEVGSLLARIETGSDHAAEPAVARESTLVGPVPDGSADRSRRRARRGESRSGTTTTATTSTTTAPIRPHRLSRPLAKPPVRLLARRLGVDLTDLAPGSGPGGIVTRSDVEAAAAGDGPDERTDGDTIPVTGVRARIAERMATSRREIPDATASVVADCTRLLEVRRALNEHAERRGLDPVVTPFSLLCRLVVQSLAQTPLLNSTFDEAGPEIRVHNGVHLGIGTATERGLVVAVVRDAERRAVHDLSAEMARLAEGARAGTLSPSDLSGSTFTVSNFGALGLDDGIPVINHPEAAILGVGSIAPRPHVVDGEVVARSTASLTLAFDHRVCDGSDAAGFLTQLRDLIEDPALSLLLP